MHPIDYYSRMDLTQREHVAVLMLRGLPQCKMSGMLDVSAPNVSTMVADVRLSIAGYESLGRVTNRGGRPRGPRTPRISDTVVQSISQRIAQGESQRSIATELGVTPQSIHALLRRRIPRKPTP